MFKDNEPVWPLTPQVSQWVSSVNGSSDVQGFVQWKPVAYRRSHPTMEDATPCRHSDPQPESGEMAAAASGLIQAFYSNPESNGLNVSFGLAGEPFYGSTRFLSWSVVWFTDRIDNCWSVSLTCRLTFTSCPAGRCWWVSALLLLTPSLRWLLPSWRSVWDRLWSSCCWADSGSAYVRGEQTHRQPTSQSTDSVVSANETTETVFKFKTL